MGWDHGEGLAVAFKTLGHALNKVILDGLEEIGRDCELIDKGVDSVFLLIRDVFDCGRVDLVALSLGDGLASDGG